MDQYHDGSTTSCNGQKKEPCRRGVNKEPFVRTASIRLVTGVRPGEARNPVPGLQEVHNHIVQNGMRTDEEYVAACCAPAADKLKQHEEAVDATTKAFTSIGAFNSERERDPYDYVMGRKPLEPTSAKAIIDPIVLSVSSINITSLDNNADNLTDEPGLTAIHEHQSAIQVHEAKRKLWRRRKKILCMGPPCTSSGHSSAGVGFQHDADVTTLNKTPGTSAHQ